LELASSSRFSLKLGRMRPSWRNSQKDEHETCTERRGARPADEFLAAPGTVWPYRKLFKVEGKEKLLSIGPPTPGVGCAARAARDRYLLTRTQPREGAQLLGTLLSDLQFIGNRH
jgi:hypothetical protein